jgi:hypothetical protein
MAAHGIMVTKERMPHGTTPNENGGSLRFLKKKCHKF